MSRLQKSEAELAAKRKGTPAVFLDRDGTINRQVGYCNHPSRLRLYRFTAAAIRKLNRKRIPVVVITNQSGVGRGYFPENALQETHERMTDLLGKSRARIDGIYYCPHAPAAGGEGCRCRKPGTGMIRKAARDLGLDLRRSYVVGDSPSDILMGKRAGTRTVLVLTGYGRGERDFRRAGWEVEPDHITRNLGTAVDWILADRDKRGITE